MALADSLILRCRALSIEITETKEQADLLYKVLLNLISMGNVHTNTIKRQAGVELEKLSEEET